MFSFFSSFQATWRFHLRRECVANDEFVLKMPHFLLPENFRNEKIDAFFFSNVVLKLSPTEKNDLRRRKKKTEHSFGWLKEMLMGAFSFRHNILTFWLICRRNWKPFNRLSSTFLRFHFLSGSFFILNVYFLSYCLIRCFCKLFIVKKLNLLHFPYIFYLHC